MRFDGNAGGRVNYAPNSFGGPVEDRRFNQAIPDHPAVVALTSCYHNLLRRWSDV